MQLAPQMRERKLATGLEVEPTYNTDFTKRDGNMELSVNLVAVVAVVVVVVVVVVVSSSSSTSSGSGFK